MLYWKGYHRGDVPFSVFHVRVYMISKCIIGDVNFDLLVKIVSSRMFSVKFHFSTFYYSIF
jgi:hypothetical protein